MRACIDESKTKAAVRELCRLRGVHIKTASAILTAWNPDAFGIYDFKVHVVLGLPGESENATVDTYIGFLAALKNLASDLGLNCSLRQVERAAWHYYPIQERGSVTFD